MKAWLILVAALLASACAGTWAGVKHDWGGPVVVAPAKATKPVKVVTAPAPPPAPVVDPAVLEAQVLLNGQQYFPGENDGVMGEGTERAIKAYQRDNGLVETGKVTEELLLYLRNTGRTQ